MTLTTLHMVLLMLSCACFIVSACNVPSKVNITALGLALLVLAMIAR